MCISVTISATGGIASIGSAELLARVGVGARQPKSGFGDPQRLRGNADASAVHQCQHVRDQAALSFADQSGGSVVVDQFAGG